ncbi:acetyltransferase [Rheinheimera sp. 1928-s]|uniref:acetyltransferase n=1 Tax=Rheinheimera sp. 1928-s TaxID=3033803 RepID=UPI00261E6D04|nr:acetyltransferase [Rheinheimera sp. 1928-s]MDF3125835.1 acetyltransferase [Rheinheimera sp. 1928-s]
MQGVILLGAGGHAKVVLEMLQLTQTPVLGVSCPLLWAQKVQQWRGLAVLGDDDALTSYNPQQVKLVNGVGMMPQSQARYALFSKARQAGFEFINLVHPSAVVSPSVQLGQGVQIMAGAVIQADSNIADNVIINSRALVEHDCVIAAHSHIAPGAVLCGQVTVAEQVFVGAGATVIQGINIAAGAVVGAGTVVVKNLAAHATVRGGSALVRLSHAISGEQ